MLPTTTTPVRFVWYHRFTVPIELNDWSTVPQELLALGLCKLVNLLTRVVFTWATGAVPGLHVLNRVLQKSEALLPRGMSFRWASKEVGGMKCGMLYGSC